MSFKDYVVFCFICVTVLVCVCESLLSAPHGLTLGNTEFPFRHTDEVTEFFNERKYLLTKEHAEWICNNILDSIGRIKGLCITSYIGEYQEENKRSDHPAMWRSNAGSRYEGYKKKFIDPERYKTIDSDNDNAQNNVSNNYMTKYRLIKYEREGVVKYRLIDWMIENNIIHRWTIQKDNMYICGDFVELMHGVLHKVFSEDDNIYDGILCFKNIFEGLRGLICQEEGARDDMLSRCAKQYMDNVEIMVNMLCSRNEGDKDFLREVIKGFEVCMVVFQNYSFIYKDLQKLKKDVESFRRSIYGGGYKPSKDSKVVMFFRGRTDLKGCARLWVFQLMEIMIWFASSGLDDNFVWDTGVNGFVLHHEFVYRMWSVLNAFIEMLDERLELIKKPHLYFEVYLKNRSGYGQEGSLFPMAESFESVVNLFDTQNRCGVGHITDFMKGNWNVFKTGEGYEVILNSVTYCITLLYRASVVMCSGGSGDTSTVSKANEVFASKILPFLDLSNNDTDKNVMVNGVGDLFCFFGTYKADMYTWTKLLDKVVKFQSDLQEGYIHSVLVDQNMVGNYLSGRIFVLNVLEMLCGFAVKTVGGQNLSGLVLYDDNKNLGFHGGSVHNQSITLEHIAGLFNIRRNDFERIVRPL